jgi:hypothetical protein
MAMDASKKREIRRCAQLYAAAFFLPVIFEIGAIFILIPLFAFCAKLGALAFAGVLLGCSVFFCRMFLNEIPLEKHFDAVLLRYGLIALYSCAVMATVFYLQPISFG